MKRRAVVTLLATVVWTVAAATPAAATDAAWLYSPDHVTEIDFQISEESRAALAAEPGEYVPASFTLRGGGETYGPMDIGLKLKGNASFRTLDGKAAFKLKFNEFVKGQKFLGLKKATLNNMVQDPTMVHEVLAYEAFRAAGLPAPRTGYSYVRINDQDYGLYLNLETLDDVSLPRWYASTQHLYEGEWTVDIVPGGASAFEIDEGDEEDLSDLEALIAAVDTWEGIDAVADLEQITRFWAVEKYIGHADGYSADPVPNNYYLHSDDTGRFTMIPWGTDWTWDIRLAYGDDGPRMFEQCRSDSACLALYVGAVLDVRELLGGLDLAGLASDTSELIDPWRRIDPRRESTLETIEERLVALQHFLAVRPDDLRWRSPPGPEPAVPLDPAVVLEEPPARLGDPPPGAGPPLLRGSRRLAVGAVRIARGRLAAAAEIPHPGRVAMRVTARIGGKRRTVCEAARRAAAAGTLTLRCQLTRAARRRLRAGALAMTVRLRLVQADGSVLTSTRPVRFSWR